MNGRTTRWIIAAAIAVLIVGAVLSRTIEPGVRVEKVTLAEDTPALKFIPTAAGFICYAVDHGARSVAADIYFHGSHAYAGDDRTRGRAGRCVRGAIDGRRHRG